ncbi:cell division protein FtsL [Paracoccus sp. (in: a-proteobacteria)]|uniref:cell division protein FtsL n=1 Tax=Paracoccus sp. TaxID=267 RepID=UPI00289AEC6A|nr:cell division protein FtsL [Paracoccus sp. (in: a-proteobacteria)]
MRSILYLTTALVVMGLAFWAYRENYRTQDAIKKMESIQYQIGGLRQDIGLLRAEWSFLNRPARLRELVDLNFEKLKLVPITSDQFVDISQVAYALPKPVVLPDAEAPLEESEP